MMSVKLTSKGDSRLKEILPGYFQRIASLMSALTESERKTLVRLLVKIVNQAGASSQFGDGLEAHEGPAAAASTA
jgi:DNA-binding MarR family transcriptional regulator